MRKPPLGYYSAIFGRPAEIIENALAALNRFGNRISARIDRMSEPSRRALVEEWVRSNKP